MGVLRDMAAFLLVTEPVAMELVFPLVEAWSNRLTAQIVSSLRSFSSLPVSLATPCSSIFLSSLFFFPPLLLPLFSQQKTLINYIRFIMSAGAATQFHFDTVFHVTPAAQLEREESFTYLLPVLEKMREPHDPTFSHLCIYWTVKKFHYFESFF